MVVIWYDDVKDILFNVYVYILLLMKLFIVLKIYKVRKWIKVRIVVCFNWFK